MARSDRRYLERMNGGGWRVVVDVPRALHREVGKTKLKEALNTDSLVVANQLKHPVVARLRASIDEHRAGRQVDKLTREAIALRQALQAAGRASEAREYSDYDAITDAIAQRAEQIAGPAVADEDGEPEFDRQREARATTFVNIALGRATPLDGPLATFKAEKKKWSARTMADFERALGYLQTWLPTKEFSPTMEAVTRRVAGEFVSHRLAEGGLAPKTINKYLSGLSGYWEWLGKKGYVEQNVWRGQRTEIGARSDDDDMRAFTADEMVALFSHSPRRAFVYDAMVIAALTGARLGVIVGLKVRDIEGDCIRFPAAKHERNSRLVPIHPDLRPVVEARLRGKQAAEDLFPEVPPRKPGDDPRRERGQPLTKSFGTYRISIGIDDPRPTDGKSRINFHSFRRWFISQANEALNRGAQGYSPWTIAEVVAHSKGDMPLDMTMGHYKAADSREAWRACVESVRLPEAILRRLRERYGAQ